MEYLKNLEKITPTYIAQRIDDSTMESGTVPHGIIAYELGYRAGWMAAVLLYLDRDIGCMLNENDDLKNQLKNANTEIFDLKNRVEQYQEASNATDNPNA